MTSMKVEIASISQLESQWPDLYVEWLSDLEREQLTSISHTNRHREWLAGRWLGKHIVQRDLEARQSWTVPLLNIEIVSSIERGLSGKPRVSILGQMQPTEVSISHSENWIIVAMSNTPGCRVGVDLVPQSAERLHSIQVWLTRAEQQWVDAEPDQLPVLWAIKESVYKAANRGESFHPGEIEISRQPDGEYACYGKCLNSDEEYSIMIERHFDHIVAITTIQNQILAGTL